LAIQATTPTPTARHNIITNNNNNNNTRRHSRRLRRQQQPLRPIPTHNNICNHMHCHHTTNHHDLCTIHSMHHPLAIHPATTNRNNMLQRTTTTTTHSYRCNNINNTNRHTINPLQ
jgi:hypothetical protein